VRYRVVCNEYEHSGSAENLAKVVADITETCNGALSIEASTDSCTIRELVETLREITRIIVPRVSKYAHVTVECSDPKDSVAVFGRHLPVDARIIINEVMSIGKYFLLIISDKGFQLGNTTFVVVIHDGSRVFDISVNAFESYVGKVVPARHVSFAVHEPIHNAEHAFDLVTENLDVIGRVVSWLLNTEYLAVPSITIATPFVGRDTLRKHLETILKELVEGRLGAVSKAITDLLNNSINIISLVNKVRSSLSGLIREVDIGGIRCVAGDRNNTFLYVFEANNPSDKRFKVEPLWGDYNVERARKHVATKCEPFHLLLGVFLRNLILGKVNIVGAEVKQDKVVLELVTEFNHVKRDEKPNTVLITREIHRSKCQADKCTGRLLIDALSIIEPATQILQTTTTPLS